MMHCGDATTGSWKLWGFIMSCHNPSLMEWPSLGAAICLNLQNILYNHRYLLLRRDKELKLMNRNCCFCSFIFLLLEIFFFENVHRLQFPSLPCMDFNSPRIFRGGILRSWSPSIFKSPGIEINFGVTCGVIWPVKTRSSSLQPNTTSQGCCKKKLRSISWVCCLELHL